VRYVVRPCDEPTGRTWDVVEVTEEQRRDGRRAGDRFAGTCIRSGFATRAQARAYALKEKETDHDEAAAKAP